MRVVPPPLRTTIWPPPENVDAPVEIVAFVRSTVTFTSFDSPGSSENDDGSVVTFSPPFAATLNVNGARKALRIVRRRGRVAVTVARAGDSRPSVSAGGSAPIVTLSALTGSTGPLPAAITSSLTLLAE